MLGVLFNPSIIYNNNSWQKHIKTTKQQANIDTFRSRILQWPLSCFLSQPFHPKPPTCTPASNASPLADLSKLQAGPRHSLA